MIRNIAWAALLLVGITACATRADVDEIVAKSNAALIAPSLEQAGEGGPIDVEEVAKRIDEFIAEHPDQPALTHPLRLRQALMYAYKGWENHAKAALKLVSKDYIHSARDRSLLALGRHIAWWCAVKDQRVEKSDGDRALAAFDTEIKSEGLPDDARDYLAEMRAYIAAKTLAAATTPESVRAYFNDGVTKYDSIFTDQDRGRLNGDSTDSLSLQSERRIARAASVVKAFRAGLPEDIDVTWPEWMTKVPNE